MRAFWGSGEILVSRARIRMIVSSVGREAVMEWVVKIETKNGWGEVETIEVGRLARGPTGLSAEEFGLTLTEGKNLLGELGRLILQTQMEEFITFARVCGNCLKLRPLRDRRTRKVQTLFGTITVDAPRIRVCSCRAGSGFVDVSQSPLAELLPDRCTPELCRLQAELSARHSYRESARLLETLLPCGSVNHATMRNRTHRTADDLEAAVPSPLETRPRPGDRYRDGDRRSSHSSGAWLSGAAHRCHRWKD
jgi:hypothetical protein